MNELSFTDRQIWLNKPHYAEVSDDRIFMISDENTDFWEKTYYGFQHHNGHAVGAETTEDFTFQVRIRANFRFLYDQAGVLIRRDESHWIKAGIEFNDGQPSVGCVVTSDFSDWSTGIFPGDPGDFWIRATLKNDAVRIQYSTDGQTWPLLRLSPWPGGYQTFIGVMCCSPTRKELSVEFTEFSLTPALSKDLHDLS